MHPVECPNCPDGGPQKGFDQDMAGAQDTIYLCNFRVSVDGEWLCLKELDDYEFADVDNNSASPQLSLPPSPEDPSPMFMGMLTRDPAAVERSNLLKISKLIVKELLETSLKYGRMLDSDHMPLQHFFIVLEHVLRHGLRPKKGLLGPKKELWDILQMVEKLNPEAQDMTNSVRDLPTVRTATGRARAWLRLALMQKKLADYLKVLVDHKDDVLRYYFEPDALLMSEEAIIIIGLLVGLNIIDCNLCVKEEDLDCQQGVIDFSLYLRSTHSVEPSEAPPAAGTAEEELERRERVQNMTTVLDQKNYIEELNRHLSATVANLEAKVESLTTTNALMSEDLAISKKGLSALLDENTRIKNELAVLRGENPPAVSAAVSSTDKTDGGEKEGSKTSESSHEVDDLKKQLQAAQKRRDDLEKELALQLRIGAENEVAMGRLEKDIHEKQDTVVSLRRQLEDIKIINLEMYKKLQECEEELTQKGEMVSRLQAKTMQIGNLLNSLQKCKDSKGNPPDLSLPLTSPKSPLAPDKAMTPECDSSLKHKTELISKLEAKSVEMAESVQGLDEKYQDSQQHIATLDVRIEQLKLDLSLAESEKQHAFSLLEKNSEIRASLEQSLENERGRNAEFQLELAQLRDVASKFVQLQEDYYSLKDQCSQHEQTLEELGTQLSMSKLQVADLQEAAQIQKRAGVAESTWMSDKEVSHCKGCSLEFSIKRRRHHCRNCGDIFCNACSDNTMPLPSSAKPARVCDKCHVIVIVGCIKADYTALVPQRRF